MTFVCFFIRTAYVRLRGSPQLNEASVLTQSPTESKLIATRYAVSVRRRCKNRIKKAPPTRPFGVNQIRSLHKNCRPFQAKNKKLSTYSVTPRKTVNQFQARSRANMHQNPGNLMHVHILFSRNLMHFCTKFYTLRQTKTQEEEGCVELPWTSLRHGNCHRTENLSSSAAFARLEKPG